MIKRLTAISLIALLVFNWYGYRFLVNYWELQSSTQLQAKLDHNDYDESTLLEIRVPLNMPYIQDWDEFETYYGETEINGTHYKYVKRKVERGELVLLCIPHAEKTQLQDASNNYFKLVNDLQQPNGKKDSKDHSVKTPFSEYITNTISFADAESYTTTMALAHYAFVIPSAYIATPSQPPEC